MFFVIPEMPSKTFVMLYKKLPDHFDQKYLIIFNIGRKKKSFLGARQTKREGGWPLRKNHFLFCLRLPLANLI